jgi:hypothetical protein
MRLASTHGLKTRFRHLDIGDWTGIIIFLVAMATAIYTWTLRHP